MLLALSSLRVVVSVAVVRQLENLELVILVAGNVALLLQALNLASSDLQAVVGDARCLLLQESSLRLLKFFGVHHLRGLGVVRVE